MSVVMKFGGTSVADADAIDRLIGIVRRQMDVAAPPVVVVSALSGVTDSLIHVASLAEGGDAGSAASALQALRDRHVRVAVAVTTETESALVAAVCAEFDE